MTINEFENHTGIFPDLALYMEACREYEAKDENGEYRWSSQASFCNDYKFNEYGIAKKIQERANKRWTELEAANQGLKAEVEELNNANEKLRSMISEMSERVDELSKVVDDLPTVELDTTEPECDDMTLIKSDMMDSLLDAAKDGHDAATVLHMVFGFNFLCERIMGGDD